MTNILISAVLLALAASGIVTAILINYAMVVGINSKRKGSAQISCLSRDTFGIVQEHRQVYPKSNLPIAFAIALVMGMAGAFGFVLLVAKS